MKLAKTLEGPMRAACPHCKAKRGQPCTSRGKPWKETHKAREAAGEQEEAREHLRKILPPGSKVYTIIRHVSSSGMMRHIDVYAFKLTADGKAVDHLYLSGWVATALDYPRAEGWVMSPGALKVGGCGMDMGFHIVHSLSYALHGHISVGKEANKADERGRPFTATRKQYRAGYSLEHRSL